jgi:hypothetical protein
MAAANAIVTSTGYSPLELFLDRLDRLKATGPGTWVASCPASNHRQGDRSRGLSVREGDDGRVLFHCFAGCTPAEVVSAMGLELVDLFPQRVIEYPAYAPKKGYFSQPRPKRIPRRDLLEGISHDLRVCSLAFSDLAAGKDFSIEDSRSIARRAEHLADEISEVLHGY